MTTTLLGVDDSKTMRKVLEITFAGEDFRTVLAENADDAMSKLHAERPSVVLVDAALEGTTGYDLCQRVKAAAPGVSVLLLSSKQQPYDRNRGSLAGADDFIDKPFDTQQLIDKVVNVLRKSAPAPQAAKSAPQAAPVPAAVVTARPGGVEPVARPRTATLAYGSHFTPQGAGAPVAPLVPPAVGSARGAQPSVKPAPAPPAAASPVTVTSPSPPMVAPAPASAPTAAPAAATSAAVQAHTGNGSDLAHKLTGLGLTADQVAGVLALSRDVVEKVVWEVVPTLAEALIKEEIRRLTSE